MKKFILALFVFSLAGLVNLPARNKQTKDLAAVVMGIRFAVVLAEESEEESGGNPDASLTWQQTGYGEILKLNFRDFTYALWNDEGKTHVITLNGELDMRDSGLNGTLKVRGDTSFSTFTLYDFYSDDDAGGKLTADGLSYTDEELEDIFDDEVFYNGSAVVTWEIEAFMACGLAFMACGELDWDTGENVLGSLLEREARPEPGSSVSNSENTLRIIARPEGMEFIFNKFSAFLPGDILFALITGKFFLRLAGQDPAALSFDGTADFEGLAGISRVQFRQCLLSSEFLDGDAGGSMVVDGREFLFFDVLSYIDKMFNMF
jgi:hypothetical protein